MNEVNDIIIFNSPVRRRGSGKDGVMILFNKPIAWWLPTYDEIETFLKLLNKVDPQCFKKLLDSLGGERKDEQ